MRYFVMYDEKRDVLIIERMDEAELKKQRQETERIRDELIRAGEDLWDNCFRTYLT